MSDALKSVNLRAATPRHENGCLASTRLLFGALLPSSGVSETKEGKERKGKEREGKERKERKERKT